MSIGVDGCRIGWFCVYRDGGALTYQVVGTLAKLFTLFPHRTVAIDSPIGLPASGPRAVDRAARRRLGERRSSVFPAPIRPVLGAEDREAASEIGESVDGRRLTAQTWAIVPKIVELDNALQNDPTLLTRVHECHPEVCWAEMNQGQPMRFRKKSAVGRTERLALVDTHFGPAGRAVYNAARDQYLRRQVALDDVLDALCCLWTAERIAAGQAVSLLPQPEIDPLGIPMQMAY